MKTVNSGYACAAALSAAVFSVMLILAVCVYTPDYLTQVAGFAVALCYPSGGADTLLHGSLPEAMSPAAAEDIPETMPVSNEPETVTQPVTEALPATAVPGAPYSEPADIADMAKEFVEEYADASPSGRITEEFFGSGAAVTAGNAAVRNSTATKSPDYEALLTGGADFTPGEKGEISVLIIHTHTTEGYQLADTGVFYSSFSSRSTLPDRNIVRVGDMLTETLRSYGVGVIHDTEVYDSAYNGAYSRSRAAIARYLEEYPSLQIVLDVHRDAIYYSDSVRCKPAAEINGRKAAQIMIISGAEEGIVTSFPDWESNLAFALQLQDKAASLYSGLMKPIYFCQRKYNMDMTRCSLLVEIGTDSNTVGEAVYSAYLLGNALGQLISGFYGQETG